jgi:phage baseplate assembly protein W
LETLAIVDGDLVMSANSFLYLTGPNKLKQDLYFALHEHYGADPYHPLWGTILGQFVGLPMTPMVEQNVLNEVNRVLMNYIAVQADLIKSYNVTDTRSSISTADVIGSINSVQAQQVGTSLMISVTLTTMAGQQLVMRREVSA